MSLTKTNDEHLILWCRILVCITFLGRAWQHLRWDAPFRTLLWNQKLMEPIVTGFYGMPWRDWVSDLSIDTAIQGSIRVTGVFYLLCAVVALFVTSKNRILQGIMIAGAAMLFGLSLLYFMDKYYRIGQLLEYSLQFSAPLFLLAALRGHLRDAGFIFGLKCAIAATFIGHGLYAAGIYPMPGNFVTMIMNGIHVSEDTARTLLLVAGIADFAVAVFLFVPNLEKFAACYTIFWGGATAFARLVSYYDSTQILGWLDAWGYQWAYRVTHGGMPILLLLLLLKSQQSSAPKMVIQPKPVPA